METKPFLQKTYVQVLLTLLLVSALGALLAYANLAVKQAAGVYTGETTISVNGEGEVLAKPDIGTFSFSVQADGADAAEAQTVSTKAMDAVVTYLKQEGVDEKDIKTQNYNLSPKYRYEERVCSSAGYCPPGDRILDGYQVTQSVTVKIRNLDQAGTLITGVGEHGASNISSLQFTIDDPAVLQMQARKEAIDDAKSKAQTLADDLGMKIHKIVGFNENGGGYPVPYGMGGNMTMEAAADSKAAPAVVPTGENTITSNVTITYELW